MMSIFSETYVNSKHHEQDMKGDVNSEEKIFLKIFFIKVISITTLLYMSIEPDCNME
jgi:hypothetical protein